MNIIIEIRPGEGGEDARLLVREQARLYLNLAQKSGLAVELLDDAKG